MNIKQCSDGELLTALHLQFYRPWKLLAIILSGVSIYGIVWHSME